MNPLGIDAAPTEPPTERLTEHASTSPVETSEPEIRNDEVDVGPDQDREVAVDRAVPPANSDRPADTQRVAAENVAQPSIGHSAEQDAVSTPRTKTIDRAEGNVRPVARDKDSIEASTGDASETPAVGNAVVASESSTRQTVGAVTGQSGPVNDAPADAVVTPSASALEVGSASLPPASVEIPATDRIAVSNGQGTTTSATSTTSNVSPSSGAAREPAVPMEIHEAV